MSNYTKLKTNLKLTIQRLKLLQKKKNELSHKSRKEIADYLTINKVDRAKIRVEHIIREDNYVEAMDLLESYCDLLLARFGLIEKMKELDPGLDEAIATIIWAAPRVSSDIQEFKIISDCLTSKYGKSYADACKTDSLKSVNEKVKKRLGIEPPSKRLVEHYMIEIAKNYNVNYTPDASAMLSQSREVNDIIDFGDDNHHTPGGSGGHSASGGGMPNPGSYQINNQSAAGQQSQASNLIGFDDIAARAPILQQPEDLTNYHEKQPLTGPVIVSDPNVPLPYKPGAYTNQEQSPPPMYSNAGAKFPNLNHPSAPPRMPPPIPKTRPSTDDFLDLPSVPDDAPVRQDNGRGGSDNNNDDDINFDDLQKRFQNLKK